MDKQIINTSNAPAPIGSYSQAVKAAGLLFISGQIALNDGQVFDEKNISEETSQIMNNLKAILETAGLGFDRVVKTTIFLKDMDLFATVNTVYSSFFTSDFPARETVAVKGLPKNVNVEISMIASDK